MRFAVRFQTVALVFWVLAVATIPVWAHLDHCGWDIDIYHNAITAMQAGHDPYVNAMAAQEEFHRNRAQHPDANPPFSYVYSPITLPLLRAVGNIPEGLSYAIYWGVLIAGVLSTLWVMSQLARTTERDFMTIVLPAAVFFPGLLAHDTILSGNVAFILYAAVLMGAAYGWRTHRWRYCYAAIVIASCFKAPLLSLIAIPVFSARKQLPSAGLAAFTSIGLFAVQPLLRPSLFHNFLKAVELQFSYNRDFGSSPAGIFSNILVSFGIPYSPYSGIFYLCYAAVIIASLFYLSRRFLDGVSTLQQWIPVLLTGVILLNPRIMEYDAAPLALPMALIGWRFLKRRLALLPATFVYLVIFLTVNCIAAIIYVTWKPIECCLLIGFFALGCWDLLHPLPVESATTTVS